MKIVAVVFSAVHLVMAGVSILISVVSFNLSSTKRSMPWYLQSAINGPWVAYLGLNLPSSKVRIFHSKYIIYYVKSFSIYIPDISLVRAVSLKSRMLLEKNCEGMATTLASEAMRGAYSKIASSETNGMLEVEILTEIETVVAASGSL